LCTRSGDKVVGVFVRFRAPLQRLILIQYTVSYG
jgi:hypothetical protein